VAGAVSEENDEGEKRRARERVEIPRVRKKVVMG
jgi:hypothetical protein